MTAQEKSGEYIGFYVKTSGDESLAGLVVTMRNRNQKEAVFVNLAGDIKLDQFATVGKALDLDPLRKVARAIKQ